MHGLLKRLITFSKRINDFGSEQNLWLASSQLPVVGRRFGIFQPAAPRACSETRAQLKLKALSGMTCLAALPRGGGIPRYGTARTLATNSYS